MKKLTLLLTLGLSLISVSAFAYDYGYRHDNRTAYVQPGRDVKTCESTVLIEC